MGREIKGVKGGSREIKSRRGIPRVVVVRLNFVVVHLGVFPQFI
jgi:hypothetical protein